MKDPVLVKSEDKFSALPLLEFLVTAVDNLREKLNTEQDENAKQMIRGAIAAYVELHTILLQQVLLSRIPEGTEGSGHYDA
jgi:hypothetical protein